ncbi:MAG TPA: DUF2334 domain-containing protein [Candidatus Nitrosocosmicus sp.]|nr:DUF2334 domain-containing protein [Candidatus Nitrosocosmicus sp.]
MKIVPLIGPCGKIPILIRDDDINFFTQYNKLNLIYSEAWKKSFKVSFSIIPYQISMNDPCVPPNYRNVQKNCYSIEKNEKLCSYLREKIAMNQVEIIQHGLTHKLSNGRGEFSEMFYPRILNPVEDSREKVPIHNIIDPVNKDQKYESNFEAYLNIGRNILKKSLNIDPLIFVPPYDDISYENINLISRAGMIPVYGQSKYHKLFRSNLIPSKIKSYLVLRIIKKFANKGFIIPLMMSNLDYFKAEPKNGLPLYIPRRLKLNPISQDEKELIASESKVFLNWVYRTVAHCKIYRNPICILNHYHHYFYDWHQYKITRNNLFTQWSLILNLLDKIPFSWKTNFYDLYQRIQDIRKIKFTETGNKITIQSSQHAVTDLSFKVDKKIELKNDNIICDHYDERIITVKKINPGTNVTIYLR